VTALAALAAPCYLALLAEVGMSLTTVALALGRFPDPALVGGAAVAISVFNAVAAAPTLGAASALSTLAAAAHGAGELAEVGVLAQRGLLVSIVFAFATLPVLLVRPRPLLRLLLGAGDATGVVDVAAVYLRWSAVAVFPLVTYDALRRFLLAGGVATPMVVSSAAALAVNVVAHVGLVGWSAAAAPPPPATTVARVSALALVASHTVNAAVLGCLVIVRRLHRGTWAGWRPAAAVAPRPLLVYLQLAASGAAQECAEWWALEVTTLVAARYGAVVLAAHVALVNLSFLTFLAGHALGTGAATRVATALGAGSAPAARTAALVSLAVGGGVAAAQAVATVAASPLWSAAYNTNADVVTVVRSVAPLLAAYVFCDGTLAVLNGTLRGTGRQALGAWGNLVLYWVVGLPMGVVAAAAAAGRGGGGASVLWGLWGGVTSGLVALVAGISWVVVTTDWAVQVRRCVERAGGNEGIS